MSAKFGHAGPGREVATNSNVAFECVAPAHRTGEGGPDKLTVFEGQWAFCPFDAKAQGHHWMATGGLPLPMLRHAAALRRMEHVKPSATEK